MSLSASRRVAFLALQELDSGGNPGSILHSSAMDGISNLDVRLATEIIYGTLRWQGELDFVLSHFSRRNLKTIAKPLLLALRIGLYQMRHLSRVPPRAAVDQSVRLARRFGPPGGPAFVNAVLRNAERNPQSPSLPTASENPLEFLTTTLSHPQWLAKRYLDRLGLKAATARCMWNNKVPPIYLRIGPSLDMKDAAHQLTHQGVVTQPTVIAPRALKVLNGSPQSTRLYSDGKIYIQDAGSQLIATLLSKPTKGIVWDACAAPGSKATAISWQGHQSFIASDRDYRRVRLLVDIAERCGATNLQALVADALHPPFTTPCELILLDVPCSGLGTLARNPDIKWHATPNTLHRMSDLQFDILASTARLLSPRGCLIYATCSTEPEENENVISQFLHKNPNFRVISPQTLINSDAHNIVDEKALIHTLPEHHGTDGYFAAILTRHS